MEKAECVLRALNLLAFEAARRLQAAAAAARQRDGTANSTRDASAHANAGGECDQLSADEILPLFVFALVRARVPCLYAEARLLADFLPKNCALGRYGYSLTTLQAALHFLLETSWEKIEHANRAEVAQRKEKKKRKYRSRVEALAQNEMLVELCDCPTGATHACLLQDSNGRLLRRGDHIVRLGASRNRHAIFYGGTDGQEVLHHESRRGKTSLGDQRAKLLRKVRVGICAIEAFAKGDAIVVADYRGGALAAVDVQLERARAELGRGGYDPFHLREEQWTHYCKTGATDAAAKQRYRLRALPPAPPKVTPRVDGETSTQHIAGGGGGGFESRRRRWCRRRRRA